jgi:hypothetical protein
LKPAHFVVLLAFVAAALLLVAGPGTRMDWWSFRTGFQLLRWAAYLGMGVAGLAVLLLLVPRVRAQRGTLVAALLVGLVVAWIPWNGMRQARSLPPIHDISTDTADPPAFVAVLPLRADAPNSAEYEGEAIAKAQREGYPDLGPILVALPAGDAFARALDKARAMGWEIVDADPVSGRIEATDTTFWFGFKDDVVIRVRPDGTGSRVDVRSVSRVGGSDVGANAARIRAYTVRLQD